MDVPRLNLGLVVGAIIALVAAVWLIDFDERADTERRPQRAATSESNPEPARAGTPGDAGGNASGADTEESHAASPLQDVPRIASVPSSDAAAGTLSGGARKAGRGRATTASEIEQRWRSRDPEDRAVAIDELNGLSDRMLAVDLLQQMLTRDRPNWNDPAWEELDEVDEQIKVDAVAEMLFAPEPDRSAAIRTLAGDHWPSAQQMLGELLGTTDANFEDHGELIANGIQSIGEGARASEVLLSLKQAVAAFD
jgi:hypothetical protein